MSRMLEQFREAMLAREARRVMPTDMSSAEIARLGAAVTERAVISAWTLSRVYLEAAERQIRDILNPRTEERPLTTEAQRRGEPEFFTAGTNKAASRLELKKVWEALGYEAPAGKEGTIEDLASDQRIDLVIQTNVDMARGYGQWRQGQSEEVLDLWPCAELFRAEEREKKRDWVARWEAAAVEVGDTDALKGLSAGRMVARKDSPIWEALSRFGTPYPPFDFNSGMWTRDVSREEAVNLGVIGEWDRVMPQRRSFESSSDGLQRGGN